MTAVAAVKLALAARWGVQGVPAPPAGVQGQSPWHGVAAGTRRRRGQQDAASARASGAQRPRLGGAPRSGWK